MRFKVGKTNLDVLAKLFVEFHIFLSILSDISNHINTLLNKILTNDFQDFVLLKRFSGNVERKIFTVNYTL